MTEMTPAELLRAARERQRISPAQLAVRAGISEARVRAIEAGAEALSEELLASLLLAMGERPVETEGGELTAERLPADYDLADLAEAFARSPSQRLADAIAVNRFADELARAGAAARAEDSSA